MNKLFTSVLSGIAVAFSCAMTFADSELTLAQFTAAPMTISHTVLTERTYEYPLNHIAAGDTQLPADLLHKISTRELIELWVEYPHQQNIDTLRTSFNGLQTLLQRRDAADRVLSVLRHQDDAAFNKVMSEKDLDNFSQRQMALTALMAQPEMLSQLPAYQRFYLKRLTMQRLAAMKNTPQLANSPAFTAYEALLTKLIPNAVKG